MNISLARTLGPSIPQPPVQLDEAMAVPIGRSLCAVFIDRPAGCRQRLVAEQDGAPIPRPFIAARLSLRSGGTRQVLFIAQGIETLLSRHLLLRLDGAPAAEIDPNWLQPPQADLEALIAQLSDQGLHRLLRVMLTTGASLFAQAQADLVDAIVRLMDAGGIPAVQPVAKTALSGRLLVTYPAISGQIHPMAAVVLSDGRLIRLKQLDCLAEGKLLHVLFPPGLRSAQIVASSDTHLRLASPHALRSLPVTTWLQERAPSVRDWLQARADDPCLLAAAPSSLTEAKVAIRHLSSGPAGLLHALVLQDPSRQAGTVIIECRGRRAELIPAHGADGTAILTGLAHAISARVGDTCHIYTAHHSGQLLKLAEGVVTAYDGSIPEGFKDAWRLGADVLAPLARARAGFHRAAPSTVVQHFGPAMKCGLRIVTAIGSSADMIRARAALILAEQNRTAVEVVCTITEGPLAMAARHALDQTAAIYGIPHRLVLLPDQLTPGERLYAALTQAQDAPALVLGNDVLPQENGWLSFWLQRLRRQAVLAPVLQASDGSIMATRSGTDPFAGLSIVHLPGSSRIAPRPLPDCLALGSAGIARLVQAGPPHPDPAIWIASALGSIAQTETRHPFCRFGQSAKPNGFAAALAETEHALIAGDSE